METVTLPHLEPHPLQICLFKDVSNAKFLREQLLAGNQDFEYAFLDASVLLSRNHVLAACFRAISDQLAGRLRSRNVHSEIVFSLSPNNNIAESFRRFGIQDETKDLVALKVLSAADTTASDAADLVQKHLMENVHGEAVALTDEALRESCDVARVRKVYKVEALRKGGDEALWRKEAEAYVLGSMALKGS